MVEIKSNMNITTVLFCIVVTLQFSGSFFSTDLSDEVARIDYQNRKTDFEEVSFITLNPGQTVSQVNES